MIKNILSALVVCVFFVLFFHSHYHAHAQGWSDFTIRSLPDSSFAFVEIDKNGKKVRHFPYRDINGHIDIDQLIYSQSPSLVPRS